MRVVLYPYRSPQSGISQSNQLAEPPHIAGLKVDLPTKTFIESLLTETRRVIGDTIGVRMLALFDIAGVVYLLEGIAVGFPWHSSNPNFKHVVCYRIRTDPMSHTKPRLIALDRDKISSAMRECLSHAGIDLPTYSETARIPNPCAGQRPLRLLTTGTEDP